MRFGKRLLITIFGSIGLILICLLITKLCVKDFTLSSSVFLLGIFCALALRFSDDYFDYEEDFKKGKKVLPKFLYLSFFLIASSIALITTVISKNPNLIALVICYLLSLVIFFQNYLFPKIFYYGRIFILPLYLAILCFILNNYQYLNYQIILTIISLIISGSFVLRRKNNENHYVAK